MFGVRKYPWVQVPPDHIGVVWAQVGDSLPTGMKSALYKPEFGNFSHLESFITAGGQKGVGFRISAGRRDQQGTVLFDALRHGCRAGECGGEN